MTRALPLLPMRPLLAEKIWGGRKLARYASKGAPSNRPVGESWEVADLQEGTSEVASGPFEGRSLRTLTREHGRALVGSRAKSDAFPLLVKLIDAAEDLSVQVHPGPNDLERLPGARSKDESWLILDVDPGARLLHGVKEGVSRERFRAALDNGEADRLLREIPIAPGDVVRVHPGVFHAIGRGTLLLEVQEPSDTTYRVYDFGRVGFDGRPRPLHVEEALLVGRFGALPPAKETPTLLAEGHELLVDAPSYRMERLRLSPGEHRAFELDGSTAVVVLVTRGRARVRGQLGDEVKLSQLETAIVPASAGGFEVQATSEPVEVVLAGLGGQALVAPREAKAARAVAR